MSYKLVCGIETHIELATKTKIFCSCTTQFGGEPNTHCCPVCTGLSLIHISEPTRRS